MTLLQLLKILKFKEDLKKGRYTLSTEEYTTRVTFYCNPTVNFVQVESYNKTYKTSTSLNINKSSYMKYLSRAFYKQIRQYKIANLLENTI